MFRISGEALKIGPTFLGVRSAVSQVMRIFYIEAGNSSLDETESPFLVSGTIADFIKATEAVSSRTDIS